MTRPRLLALLKSISTLYVRYLREESAILAEYRERDDKGLFVNRIDDLNARYAELVKLELHDDPILEIPA